MSLNYLDLPEEFEKLEASISAEKGDFSFFAMFRREDLPDRWDLMISAPWASADEGSALDYFIAKIKAEIGSDALVLLSRIIFIDPANESLQKLIRKFPVEHGAVEVRDRNFFGLDIKHAVFITSKSLSAPTPA
jgi:hypothetical protein